MKKTKREMLANAVTLLRLRYREAGLVNYSVDPELNKVARYTARRLVREQLETAEAALSHYDAKNPPAQGKATNEEEDPQ